MKTVRVRACAKLNLTLDILGVEGGYHMLDSLVTTVDLSDTVVASKRKDCLASIRMRGKKSESIPPERNVAQCAADAFIAAFHTQGADITVNKNIPIGGGLGGSSADAAGVLRAMAKLYGITDFSALKSLADSLGSDTGYLLTGGFARMTGRGDEVQTLPPLPTMYFLLVCPKTGVSTKECYALCDSLPSQEKPRTQRVLEDLLAGNLEWAARLFGNGLYPAARTLNPEIDKAMTALKMLSPTGVSMTGSGSSVFAYFPTLELAQWAKSRYRGKGKVYIVKSVQTQDVKASRSPFYLSEDERNLK